ncbi:hypothetical protein GJV85_08370 [Sulfurimonas aquatica]|uniref:Uncharacterized protein n=1 Tax=Sulfurimonas aquatica TaxID=2672570 RepID=A0A975GCY8_9BACT|nr:hypothetical protein [Sulfurimonas aquatica]QSZ42125.1 hypothetical protein GJV85_08370 [Sulfurimonas aquatica]
MHLEYVGNKPVISVRGVDFSIGKEDKYVYIQAATHILAFLEKIESDTSATITTNKELDEQETFALLKRLRPDFEKVYDKKIDAYKKKIEDELDDVDDQQHLNDIEKDVLEKNISYMKKYRLQRATNKIIYEELVNISVEIIMKKQISEICMPYSLAFVHLAESFSSSVTLINGSVLGDVSVMADKETPYTKLTFKGLSFI